MPDWFTTFHPAFAEKGNAMDALDALRHFAKVASIPENATWRVFVRGIGLVVTAEWGFDDPGAVPATEVDLIGGTPVLVERKEGE
jgi:hypothetical protein